MKEKKQTTIVNKESWTKYLRWNYIIVIFLIVTIIPSSFSLVREYLRYEVYDYNNVERPYYPVPVKYPECNCNVNQTIDKRESEILLE